MPAFASEGVPKRYSYEPLSGNFTVSEAVFPGRDLLGRDARACAWAVALAPMLASVQTLNE